MAQPDNNDIQLSNQAGPDYRAEHNQINLALASHHQGNSAPSYAISGMTWIDDSSTPWELKIYDGADWIVIGKIDPTNNKFFLSAQADGTELSGVPTISQFQKASVISATSGGSNNVYTATLSPAPSSYAENLWVRIKANHSNTGAATVNVNALGSKNIVDLEGNALSGGEILSGGIYDLVYDGTNFILLGSLIYNSGNASNGQILTADGLGRATWETAGSVPSGIVSPYAGATAPSGWLLCYGQTIGNTGSGADLEDAGYETLFDIVKSAYGNSGSEIFANGDIVNLPDLRGRVIAGQDGMGGFSANRLTNQSGGLNGDTLGATGGSETHALTVSEMPAHSHNVFAYHDTTNGGSNIRNTASTQSQISESTSVAGGNTPHNNIQPTIILNYIIKI